MLLTMIARVADGLPLAASMQEDEQVSCGRSPEPSGPRELALLPARDSFLGPARPWRPRRHSLLLPRSSFAVCWRRYDLGLEVLVEAVRVWRYLSPLRQKAPEKGYLWLIVITHPV